MKESPYTEIGHAAVRMVNRNVTAEGIKQTIGALMEMYGLAGKSAGGQSGRKASELRTRKKGKK